MTNPLEFLGLYRTHNNASSRPQIPAKLVSGDSTESQLLEAGRRYLHRPAVLETVLNDLVREFRLENCKDLRRALDVILLAMESHPQEKHIQISGSAGLYYIVKSDQLRYFSPREWNIKVYQGFLFLFLFLAQVKRRILKTLLSSMMSELGDQAMMRNGCLILCQFQVPADVLFDSNRLVRFINVNS